MIRSQQDRKVQHEHIDINQHLSISKIESDAHERHDNFLDNLLGSRVNPLLFEDDSVQIKKEMERQKQEKIAEKHQQRVSLRQSIQNRKQTFSKFGIYRRYSHSLEGEYEMAPLSARDNGDKNETGSGNSVTRRGKTKMVDDGSPFEGDIFFKTASKSMVTELDAQSKVSPQRKEADGSQVSVKESLKETENEANSQLDGCFNRASDIAINNVFTPREKNLNGPESPKSAVRRSTFGEPKPSNNRESLASVEEFPEVFQRRKMSRMNYEFDSYDRREKYVEDEDDVIDE